MDGVGCQGVNFFGRGGVGGRFLDLAIRGAVGVRLRGGAGAEKKIVKRESFVEAE